jgi:hypothetical protein
MKPQKTVLAAFCVAVSVFCHPAQSAPTYEQIQLYKERVSIPNWRSASQQIDAIRSKPPSDEIAKVWNSLDAENDPNTGRTPLARVSNPQNGAELQIYSMWLRWQILSRNADGRYSYAYALNLHRMRTTSGKDYAKEAAMFFLHARFALSIDGARCADSSATPPIILGYESQPTMRQLVEDIAKLPMKDRAQVMLNAVALEEMRGERPYRPWLCLKGASMVAEAFKQGRVPEPTSRPDEGSHLKSETTHTIDVSGIDPRLIPLDEWRKKRSQEIERTTRSVADEL